ncbi:MAG: CoA transferase [Chloroflexota bacterium]
MAGQALAGLKVLEYGEGVSAPFCGKLMADLGAEVIKIEKPLVGDESRQHGPFPKDVPHPERSGLFIYLNTSKLGITLDTEVATGRKLFKELARGADVLIENSPPKAMKKLGLDYKALKAINPKLVMTSLTPFGHTGPCSSWKGYGINSAALGAMCAATGSPGREPLALPLDQSGFQAAIGGAIATMLAVLARETMGRGQHVDVGEADMWATFHCGLAILPYIHEGRIRRRSGHRVLHQGYPDTTLQCKDGYITLDAPQGRQFKNMIEMMGNPEWSQHPMWKDRLSVTNEHSDEADAMLAPWLMEHTKQEIFDLSRKHRVPTGPIKTIEEIMNEEHLKVRNFWAELKRTEVGKLTYPGAPYHFSKTPWRISPAPLLGEHNEEVYCDRLGYSREELVELRRAGVI